VLAVSGLSVLRILPFPALSGEYWKGTFINERFFRKSICAPLGRALVGYNVSLLIGADPIASLSWRTLRSSAICCFTAIANGWRVDLWAFTAKTSVLRDGFFF